MTTFYRIFIDGDKICETESAKLAKAEADEFIELGYFVKIERITEEDVTNAILYGEPLRGGTE